MMLKRPQLRPYLASTHAPEVLDILADYQYAMAALNACMADPRRAHLAQEYATLCYELEEEVENIFCTSQCPMSHEGERQA